MHRSRQPSGRHQPAPTPPEPVATASTNRFSSDFGSLQLHLSGAFHHTNPIQAATRESPTSATLSLPTQEGLTSTETRAVCRLRQAEESRPHHIISQNHEADVTHQNRRNNNHNYINERPIQTPQSPSADQPLTTERCCSSAEPRAVKSDNFHNKLENNNNNNINEANDHNKAAELLLTDRRMQAGEDQDGNSLFVAASITTNKPPSSSSSPRSSTTQSSTSSLSSSESGDVTKPDNRTMTRTATQRGDDCVADDDRLLCFVASQYDDACASISCDRAVSRVVRNRSDVALVVRQIEVDSDLTSSLSPQSESVSAVSPSRPLKSEPISNVSLSSSPCSMRRDSATDASVIESDRVTESLASSTMRLNVPAAVVAATAEVAADSKHTASMYVNGHHVPSVAKDAPASAIDPVIETDSCDLINVATGVCVVNRYPCAPAPSNSQGQVPAGHPNEMLAGGRTTVQVHVVNNAGGNSSAPPQQLPQLDTRNNPNRSFASAEAQMDHIMATTTTTMATVHQTSATGAMEAAMSREHRRRERRERRAARQAARMHAGQPHIHPAASGLAMRPAFVEILPDILNHHPHHNHHHHHQYQQHLNHLNPSASASSSIPNPALLHVPPPYTALSSLSATANGPGAGGHGHHHHQHHQPAPPLMAAITAAAVSPPALLPGTGGDDGRYTFPLPIIRR